MHGKGGGLERHAKWLSFYLVDPIICIGVWYESEKYSLFGSIYKSIYYRDLQGIPEKTLKDFWERFLDVISQNCF